MSKIIDFDTLSNDILEKPVRSRKQKGKREVVHKIFAECALAVNDPFWVEKFTTLSTNKMIRNFTFHNGLLVHRKNSRKSTVEIPDNPAEAAIICMNFIRSNAGVISPQDEANALHEQQNRALMMQEQKQLTWEDANRKVRDSLISYFINDTIRARNLTFEQAQDFNQTLRLGISQKYFGSTNIHVRDNRIINIDGLLWHEDHQRYYVSVDLRPQVSRSGKIVNDKNESVEQLPKDSIPCFYNKWSDYLAKLSKKLDRDKRRQQRGRESGLFDSLLCDEEPSTADDVLDDE